MNARGARPARGSPFSFCLPSSLPCVLASACFFCCEWPIKSRGCLARESLSALSPSLRVVPDRACISTRNALSHAYTTLGGGGELVSGANILSPIGHSTTNTVRVQMSYQSDCAPTYSFSERVMLETMFPNRIRRREPRGIDPQRRYYPEQDSHSRFHIGTASRYMQATHTNTQSTCSTGGARVRRWEGYPDLAHSSTPPHEFAPVSLQYDHCPDNRTSASHDYRTSHDYRSSLDIDSCTSIPPASSRRTTLDRSDLLSLMRRPCTRTKEV
jgi:hypothetical protein